jgi:glycolate oxidase iron-sulfur subunit
VRRLLLRGVFPFPERLRALGRLGKLYQRSGLQRVARRLGLIPTRLSEVEALMPPLSERFFEPPDGEWLRAQESPARHRVGLLSGCIMSVAFADVDRATVRVLNRNGCDVFVPRSQTCCGALHAHDGDRATAQELARRNIDAFEREGLDAIVINAAGCGATMKDYAELLHDDRDYASRAEAFSARVKDVSEFLASIELNRDLGPLDRTVTYQDACHLAPGQRVREAPRTLLRAIPGLQLVEMGDSDRCCGSAGIYNITQTALSLRFMAEKSQSAAATGAEILVSGNPGCMIQLRTGLRRCGSRMVVKHIVEVLDEAYRRAEGQHAD